MTDDSKSKSKLCYDRRSVGQSVLEKAPIWGLRPDLYYCLTVTGFLMWGAFSDERTGLSFARVTAVVSVLSVRTIYILHVIKGMYVSMYVCMYVCMYVYTIYTGPLSVQAQYSKSCPTIILYPLGTDHA
jgi:hypothetical protein